MKFGKYLAARQLEFPEYSSYFMNYKQLKKLINALINQDDELTLQDKKGSFFFKVERELEKVNSFYIEKEAELRLKLELLIEKKNNSLKDFKLSKDSITFISLYDGFKKFSKDLDRLNQFVELNETGFIKVLKKWDKRSKSKTKELYLTTTVNVQPIFHKNQIVELSDLVANNLIQLEALYNGDKNFMIYEESSNSSPTSGDATISDQLYTDFYEITLQNANLPPNEQLKKLNEWYNQIMQKLNISTKKFTFSKIFMLLISNLQIPNESILKFFEFFNEFIDLNFIDDINGRTCLIETSTCLHEREEIFKICINSNIDPLIKDFNGRTCLHYLSENGRNDLMLLLLNHLRSNNESTLNKLIDMQDNDAITPLLLAIINNHDETVRILLEFNANAFPMQDESKPLYLPLNIACKFGNSVIVHLLLHKFGSAERAKEEKLLVKKSQSNAEGLLPLHIVASSGNANLVPLLLEYGADINQIDRLNKWSSIFYAVLSNDSTMAQTLIQYGADFRLEDEDGFDPLYYAIWEGNTNVFNILLNSMSADKSPVVRKTSKLNNIKPQSVLDNISITDANTLIDFNNLDMIPELSLPPPIIPLRKYGHNFLEKKIFLKLSFLTNRFSINLNPNIFMTSIPGRITINNNDQIPKNLMLPILDTENKVTFQLDSIDDENFEVDFHLFPTFGTRLLAKATLTSSILKSQYAGLGVKDIGFLELPLFDIRLNTIGSLKFTYEIIYPYSGKPLEISMYDTYWKLSSSEEDDEAKNKNATTNSTSFVTSSSLKGEYHRVQICLLNDGTPIVSPKTTVEVYENVQLSIANFTYPQLASIIYKNEANLQNMKIQLKNLTGSSIKAFRELIPHIYLPLDEFLSLTDSSLSLNLEIFYPSLYELSHSFFKEFAYMPTCKADTINNTLNYYIDTILTDIFHHVRDLRSEHSHGNRQFIFSSNNSHVCTILNWKQPNYPVFYNLNGMKFDKSDNKFIECTANGLIFEKPPTQAIKPISDSTADKNKILIDNIDSINKDSIEYTNLLDYDDKLTRSIKLAINYAISNNLLGIIVPETILNLSPEIVKSIRLKGLILVASKDTDISHLEIEDLNKVLHSDMKNLEIDGDISVNGIKYTNVITFTDSIEV